MRKFSRSKSLTIPTTSYEMKTTTTNDFEEKKKNKDRANELERIEAMTFCVRGGVLIKYGRRGKPHGAEFRFSLDGRAMEWENTKKKKTKKKKAGCSPVGALFLFFSFFLSFFLLSFGGDFFVKESKMSP